MMKMTLHEFCVFTLGTLFLLQVGRDGVTAFEDSCECGMFLQSWKTSHMIRLLAGAIKPRDSDCAHNEKLQVCKTYCTSQLQNQTLWNQLLHESCLTLYKDIHLTDTESEESPIKGCVQGYFRSCDHIWTPMGSHFRKIVSCQKHKIARRDTETSDVSISQKPNAEEAVDDDDEETSRKLGSLFKLLGFPGSVFKYGSRYAHEVDMMKCYSEFFVYTINHRYNNRGSRANNDPYFSLLTQILPTLIENKAVVNILGQLLTQKEPQPDQKFSETAENQPVATIPSIVTRVFDFLETRFGGNEINDDPVDKLNDPQHPDDSEMIRMVEEATKPFVMSVFGVVPGVPASGHGRRPHSVLQKNSLDSAEIEALEKFAPPKTGNPFYDMGNRLAYTFQSATDSTSGFYCAKQYFVNKVWNKYRQKVRSVVKYFPSAKKSTSN